MPSNIERNELYNMSIISFIHTKLFPTIFSSDILVIYCGQGMHVSISAPFY